MAPTGAAPVYQVTGVRVQPAKALGAPRAVRIEDQLLHETSI